MQVNLMFCRLDKFDREAYIWDVNWVTHLGGGGLYSRGHINAILLYNNKNKPLGTNGPLGKKWLRQNSRHTYTF